VSKVARDPHATALNKHGKMSHGAAVSKAAHDCPKGAGDGQDDNGTADQPQSAESPEPAESESPETSD